LFFKRFNESFYITLLDGDHQYPREREREREMNRWSGLRAEPVWLSACGYSMVQLKQYLSSTLLALDTHKQSHRVALQGNMQSGTFTVFKVSKKKHPFRILYFKDHFLNNPINN